jgi:sulfur-oxidizing protein SoxY
MNRRDAMFMIGGRLTIALLLRPALGVQRDVHMAIQSVFGDRPLLRGRVMLELPKLAESGNSVPLKMSVESAMSRTDRVIRACIFSNRNPRPLIATILFGPNAGTAAFSTNVRLSSTQDVIAVAEMSDHSLWTSQARVLVTIGACDALQTRY